MRATDGEQPFVAHPYAIGPDRTGAAVSLTRLEAGEPEVLGKAFAKMDPWLLYALRPDRLAGLFAQEESGAMRYAIRCDGVLAGFCMVRHPWLAGPYLQFLGLLAEYQGRGIGERALRWMEAEARRAGARNAWLCVTGVNDRARGFYRRCGYEEAGQFDDLVTDGIDEVLMRRRIGVAAPN